MTMKINLQYFGGNGSSGSRNSGGGSSSGNVAVTNPSEVSPLWGNQVASRVTDEFGISGNDVLKLKVEPIERAKDYSQVVYDVTLPNGSRRQFVIEPMNGNYIYELRA